MSLFYVATTITIGNVKIAHFCDSLWLSGEKPKYIALVFLSHPKIRSALWREH
jgi:hypothetical protein